MMPLRNTKPSIYTQLANKYNLPYQVIEVICNSPFVFANRSISDDTNKKPIMFPYLGKIKLKKKYEKQATTETTEGTSVQV